jgi:hypothetical protein
MTKTISISTIQRANGAKANDAGFTNTDNPTIGYYTRYSRKAIERAIISADHRRDVALHALVEIERPLEAIWHSALPAAVHHGEPLYLDETITLTNFSQDAPPPVLTADLSALGGSPVHELVASGDFSYRLEAVFEQIPTGRKRISIHMAQDTLTSVLAKSIMVTPVADAPIFTDTWGPNWSQGFTTKVDVAPTLFENRQVLGLNATSFTLEYLPGEPVEPSAYRALPLQLSSG